MFLGVLNAAKLKELGILPGPEYGKLKRGENITTKEGIVVSPNEVLGPPLSGRKVSCFLTFQDIFQETNFILFSIGGCIWRYL